MLKAATLLLLALAAGCVGVPTRWEKAGMTDNDYLREGQDCTLRAATAPELPSTMGWWGQLTYEWNMQRRQADVDRRWVKCMEGKGWKPAP